MDLSTTKNVANNDNFFDFEDDVQQLAFMQDFQQTPREFLSSETGKMWQKKPIIHIHEDKTKLTIGSGWCEDYTPSDSTSKSSVKFTNSFSSQLPPEISKQNNPNIMQNETKENLPTEISVPTTKSDPITKQNEMEEKLWTKILEIQVPRQNNRKANFTTDTQSDPYINLLLYQPAWLSKYKKYSDKCSLLRDAIITHDSYIILSVLSYLRNTLSSSLLLELLSQASEAKSLYYHFLQRKKLTVELIKATHACKDFYKCGLLKLNQARNTRDPYEQLLLIKNCEEYLLNVGLKDFAQQIMEEHQLLESQISIHLQEKSAGLIQESLSCIEIYSPILKSPLYTTLYYLSLNHFNSGISTTDPLSFRDKFNISDRGLLWIGLSARAQYKDWSRFEELSNKIQPKSRFSLLSSRNYVLLPSQILEIIYVKENTCWKDKSVDLRDAIIKSYLEQTDDLEDRYKWSLRFLCHPIVIDTCVKLRDKARLEDYIRNIPHFSKYLKEIENLFVSKSINWKTS